MMNTIFKDEIDTGIVIIYMDDILIYTSNLEEHECMVKRVLAKFREHKLFLKPEKCTFEEYEVEYFGLIVSHNDFSLSQSEERA